MEGAVDPLDLRALAEAKQRLEHPGLAARITAVLGTPVERGMELLPARWSGRIQEATRAALEKALAVALKSMRPGAPALRAPHRALAAASGAMGGAFGLPALLWELPLSTTIMLRSIATIAQAEGEELERVDARLACLEVFALGGRTRADDAAETGYFAVRAALARAISEAAAHAAERGAAGASAPALMRFVALVAERFGVVVSEKAAAGLVPVIGAVGGATVNWVFADHFQEMARGHFTVRRLERRYGLEAVRRSYAALP